MSLQLILASFAITAALALYTAGVFAERSRGRLTGPILALFWMGLACDTTGTTIMTAMARSSNGTGAPAIHAVTGALAIALMLLHAGWATLVWLRGRRGDSGAVVQQRVFHTFSTVVWLLWLVPYLIGLLVGVPALHMRAVCATGTSALAVAAVAVMLFRPRTTSATQRL